jgi:hypothetical protein
MTKFAYFVSAHGFGHATRACAVMAAIRTVAPAVHFEVFTLAPSWLFQVSVREGFTLHALETDVGLVQVGPLNEDLPLTLERLDAFYPLDPARVTELAEQVGQLGCAGVICDIAPLGLAVARQAELPSVLIENFTWDWIYGEYVPEAPGLQAHIDYLRQAFGWADYHLQTAPAYPRPPAHLVTAPVGRRPRLSRDEVRDRLGIPRDVPAVLVTMGGIPDDYSFIDQLVDYKLCHFILPGNWRLRDGASVERRGNATLLLHHSAFYHPDLVHASDTVIGKAGYSTVAEVYQAGVAFGYVLRARFRESAVLQQFIDSEMPGSEIPEGEFKTGAWLARLPGLLEQPRRARPGPNGADQAATFITQNLLKA